VVVCEPAAGTVVKMSCSHTSHPRRTKTAVKKRNAILAKNCDVVWCGDVKMLELKREVGSRRGLYGQLGWLSAGLTIAASLL